MDLEELVVGVKKADLGAFKELKVKLPVRLLVNLHYVRLTESRAISDVVNEALTQYFAAMGTARALSVGVPPARAASVDQSWLDGRAAAGPLLVAPPA